MENTVPEPASDMIATGRTVIGKEAIQTLETYYFNGLVGTGKSHAERLKEVANKTSLPLSVVKNWIGNQSRSRKATAAGSRPSHGRNGYQEYCREFYKTADLCGLSVSERNKRLKSSYDELPDEEKATYKLQAAACRGNCSEPARDVVVKRKLRALRKLIVELGKLDCPAVCAAKANCIEIFTNSLTDGFSLRLGDEFNHFLKRKEADLLSNRADQPSSSGVESKAWSTQDVRKLFAEKWIQSGGSGSCPPYGAFGTKFKVEGLPSRLRFQRPQDYGRKQVELIMQNRDAISFKILAGDTAKDN